jgi:hypothetical protein
MRLLPLKFFQPLAIAIAFSVLLNLFGVVDLYRNPAGSMQSLAGDDALYLGKSIALAEGRNGAGFFYFEEDRYVENQTAPHSPYDVTLLTVGLIAEALNLSISELGLLLDVVCVALSLLFFFAAFNEITERRAISWSAALVAGVFPFALLPHSAGSFLGSMAPEVYVDSEPAALRAVATQLSAVLFSLFFWRLIRAFYSEKIVAKEWNYCLFLSGLAFFVYFFAWISMSALTGAALAWKFLRNKKVEAAHLILGLVFYTGLSATGLALLARASQRGIVSDIVIKEQWFHPWPVVATLAASLLAICFTRDVKLKTGLHLISIAFFLELLLPNLQPLTGQAIAPYHFARFYLNPVVSGLLSVFLLDAYLGSRMRVAGQFLMGFLFVAFVGSSIKRAVERYDTPKYFRAWDGLLAEVRKLPKDSVIAVLPDDRPFSPMTSKGFTMRFEPNNLNALTGRYLLSQDWLFRDIGDPITIEREMLMSFLYTGRPQMIWSCPQIEIEMPGDLFSLTWTSYRLRRKQQCEILKDYIERPDLCGIAQRYRVDYAVILGIDDQRWRENLEKVARQIWSGEMNTSLYQIDKSLLIERACFTS